MKLWLSDTPPYDQPDPTRPHQEHPMAPRVRFVIGLAIVVLLIVINGVLRMPTPTLDTPTEPTISERMDTIRCEQGGDRFDNDWEKYCND